VASPPRAINGGTTNGKEMMDLNYEIAYFGTLPLENWPSAMKLLLYLNI